WSHSCEKLSIISALSGLPTAAQLTLAKLRFVLAERIGLKQGAWVKPMHGPAAVQQWWKLAIEFWVIWTTMMP
ncbi:MAG: hypothetical protein SFV81_17650, partial [Pirellulaceae bacterium]|nr:hypothetical protein [Pirellulaceae bacterium]